jgi:hypothetical protein
MDIAEIRLRNYKALKLLFRDRPDQQGKPQHGLLVRFSEAAGVNARYLSHIENGRKNIGDKLAREMEAGLGLEFGWMDHDHEVGAVQQAASPAEREFLELAQRLFRHSPVEAQALLMRYMADRVLTQPRLPQEVAPAINVPSVPAKKVPAKRSAAAPAASKRHTAR